VIANNEDKFPNASLLGFNEQVLQDRLVSYGEHYLGSGAGKGAHSAPFPSS